jgi:hypothetical protein
MKKHTTKCYRTVMRIRTFNAHIQVLAASKRRAQSLFYRAITWSLLKISSLTMETDPDVVFDRAMKKLIETLRSSQSVEVSRNDGKYTYSVQWKRVHHIILGHSAFTFQVENRN